jgi:hypothetical protein
MPIISSFDQDLPVECDDEYWNLHEPQNFKQPKDKPSDLSYFICYAKLLEIQAAVATAIVNLLRQQSSRSNYY